MQLVAQVCKIRSPRYIVVTLAGLLPAPLGAFNKASVTTASSGTEQKACVRAFMHMHVSVFVQKDCMLK